MVRRGKAFPVKPVGEVRKRIADKLHLQGRRWLPLLAEEPIVQLEEAIVDKLDRLDRAGERHGGRAGPFEPAIANAQMARGLTRLGVQPEGRLGLAQATGAQ